MEPYALAFVAILATLLVSTVIWNDGRDRRRTPVRHEGTEATVTELRVQLAGAQEQLTTERVSVARLEAELRGCEAQRLALEARLDSFGDDDG